MAGWLHAGPLSFRERRMEGKTVASPGATLRGTLGRTTDNHEASLRARAERALALAARHRERDEVFYWEDLGDVAQLTLQAASIGSLGCSAETAALCGRALKEWETAKRERANAEAAARSRV